MAREVKAKPTKITDYVPDPTNANKHSERGQAMLSQSLSEVGLGRSIVVDRNGVVVGGNLTQEQAVDQGFEDAIEVQTDGKTMVVVRRMDLDLGNDEDNRARRLAYFDNRVGEVSLNWDAERIKLDIESGVDLNGIFDKAELKRVINQIDGAKSESRHRVQHSHEELIEKWQVKAGDIWEFASVNGEGVHRLMCGDSRTELNKLMAGRNAELLVTSPPYGVGKDYESGGVEDWFNLVKAVFTASKEVASLHFINLGDRKTNPEDIYELHTYGMMDRMLLELGFNLLSLRVWVKPPAWSQNPFWRNTYKAVDDFEFLGLYAVNKPKHVTRLSDGEMNDWGYRGTWNVASVGMNAAHSAEFPVELPLRAIRLFSDVGDLILDPFGGRGTTLEAAESVGRTCYLMEKEVGYVAETLERFEEYLPRRVEK